MSRSFSLDHPYPISLGLELITCPLLPHSPFPATIDLSSKSSLPTE